MKQIVHLQPDANLELIPEHCRDSLIAYIEYGRPVGDFLAAVICNDLRGAIGRADEVNLPRLKDYITLLYQYVPSECWGNGHRYSDWLRKGMDARKSA